MNILYFFAASISLKCGIMLFDIFAEDSLVALLLTLTVAVCAFLSAHLTYPSGKGKTMAFIVFCVLSVAFIILDNMLSVNDLELVGFRPMTLLYLVDVPLFVYFNYWGGKIVEELEKRQVMISSAFLVVFFVSFVVIWNIRDVEGAKTIFSNTTQSVYATNGYTKSEYFSSAEDKHIVIIEVPSLTDAVLNTRVDGKPLLPNFSEFFEQTLYFDNFYSEVYDGSVDIQFAAINSLFPTLDNTIASYHENKFNSLANILDKAGYRTTSIGTAQTGLHNRGDILRACGFEEIDVSNGDKESFQMVVDATTGNTKTFQYVTLSTSAYPYISEKTVDTGCGDIINDMVNSLVEADKLFGEFIEQMKENGGYEKTVIAVFGTATELSVHKRASLSSYGMFSGEEYLGFQTYCAPFGIRVPKLKPTSFGIVSSIYDIFPTIMDVLGQTDEYMLVYGDSALRSSSSGNAFFVLGDAYRGSYVDGDHIYIKARNGNDQIYNTDLSYASLSSCLKRSKEVIRMVGECELFYKKNIFVNMDPKTFSDIASENERVTLVSPLSEDSSIGAFYRDDLLKQGEIITVDKLDGACVNIKLDSDTLRVKNILDGEAETTVGIYYINEMKIGAKSLTLAPFGDGEIYVSFLIDGAYTEYFEMNDVAEQDLVTITNGNAKAKDDKKIEKIKIKVILKGEDEFYGLNVVVGDACYKGGNVETDSLMKFDENELIYPENEDEKYTWLLNTIEKNLLGRTKNKTADSLYALVGSIDKEEILVFFDNYDSNAVKEALSIGAVVTAIDKNGDVYVLVGYDEKGLKTIDKKGKIIEFDKTDWEGRVMVAQNNDKELVIIEDFIPIEALIRPGYVNNDKKYIVIHNTGNYSKDSDAALHALYLHNQAASATPREASWHYTVDDKVVYYHIPDNENAWHASDGNFGNGNYHGIGIEICVNGFPEVYSGPAYEIWLVQFKAALDNAAKLTAQLMVKYDLDMSSIKQHYDFARDKKNCPMQMRYNSKTQTFERDTGDMWIYFLEKTEAEWKKLENK